MTGYEPLNTLKPVAPGIWIIDGPAVISRRMPISTRATVIEIDGGLWVHSPTDLTPELQAELDALAPVKVIIVPNWEPSVFAGAWRVAYPEAVVWAVPEEGARGSAVAYDHVLGDDTPWWGDAVDHFIVGGSKSDREAVFFHRASATLIVADLIQNFDTAKLPTWMRPIIWLAGSDNSNGKMPYLMRRRYRDTEALGDAAVRMVEWRPQRIILARGDCYRTGAVQELERIFKKLLQARQWESFIEQEKERQQ